MPRLLTHPSQLIQAGNFLRLDPSPLLTITVAFSETVEYQNNNCHVVKEYIKHVALIEELKSFQRNFSLKYLN